MRTLVLLAATSMLALADTALPIQARADSLWAPYYDYPPAPESTLPPYPYPGYPPPAPGYVPAPRYPTYYARPAWDYSYSAPPPFVGGYWYPHGPFGEPALQPGTAVLLRPIVRRSVRAVPAYAQVRAKRVVRARRVIRTTTRSVVRH